MSARPIRASAWRAVLLAVTLAAAVTAQTSADPLLDRGLTALAAGRYEEAAAVFRQGAANADSPERRGNFAFYYGLAEQRQATQSEGAEAEQRWRSAARWYQRAAQALPDSAGTRNNLAQALDALGEHARAERAFRQAISLNDSRQPVYLSNYAAMLARLGRTDAAIGLYRRALNLDPELADAHQALIELYVRSPDDGPDYLWAALDRGYTVRTLDGALTLLEDARPDESDIEELMALVATCLSRWDRSRERFLASDSGSRLIALGCPMSR